MISIYLSDIKLQFVELIKLSKAFKLSNIGEYYFNQAVNWLHVLDRDSESIIEISSALRKLSESSFADNSVSLILPNDLFIVEYLPFDINLSKNEAYEYYYWELSLLYPQIDISSHSLKVYQIHNNHLSKDKHSVVVAFPTQIISKLIELMKEFGYFVKNIECSAFALNKSVCSLYKKLMQDIIQVIHIGESYSSVSILNHGELTYFRRIKQNYSDLNYSSLSKFVNINLINENNSKSYSDTILFIDDDLEEDAVLPKLENIKYTTLNPINSEIIITDNKIITKEINPIGFITHFSNLPYH